MIRKGLIVLAGLLGAGVISMGCAGPRPLESHMESPYPRTRVAAIAPFLNQSGSAHVDPLGVSDIFYSELQMVRGFQVLPVNRSLQAMVALNMRTVTSPADALRLAEFLGADIIFVGAITSYDPYDPPEVGMAVQIYALPARNALAAPAPSASTADPADAANPADADPAADPADAGPFAAESASGNPARPKAQVNDIYNANHENVRKQLLEYAEIRSGGHADMGLRLYTKSIQMYLRFCSYMTIRQLLDLERDRLWMAGTGRAAK